MSVLYRAMWNDDRTALPDAALSLFSGWVSEKAGGRLIVPADGSAEGTTQVRSRSADGSWVVSEQPAEVKVARVSGPGGRAGAVRASLVEMRDDGSRWATTLRSWVADGPEDEDRDEGAGWLWVDVEAVTSEPLDGLAGAAPRLVRDLISSGVGARRRCVPLTAGPVRYEGEDGAEELAGLLSHADRDLPMVVVSDEPVLTRPPAGPPFFEQAVERAALRVLGVAAIAVVDPSASRALSGILGSHHGVWGGAFRTYLPGVDPAQQRDEWRHRYVRREQWLRQMDTAGQLIARALAPSAAARRAPASYAAAKRLLDDARGADAVELAELLKVADEEAAQQLAAAAASEERYRDLLADHQEALKDRARLAAALDLAGRRLAYAESLVPVDRQAASWVDGPAASGVPATAGTPSEAAWLAREHLAGGLDLPEEVCIDLGDLDGALEAGSWGQTSWEGLRALHAYAGDLRTGRDPGSFWTWCEQSGHPLAWRATPKKLAMSESQSVETREKLRRHRVLPVSKDVDPSGRVYMGAHLKIAEGGGPLAPRIYFHVSRLDGGTVHVGYFGPHRNMPNTKT